MKGYNYWYATMERGKLLKRCEVSVQWPADIGGTFAYARSLALSAGGRYLVAANLHKLVVCDLEEHIVNTLITTSDEVRKVWDAAIAPNGYYAASSTEETRQERYWDHYWERSAYRQVKREIVKLWDLRSGVSEAYQRWETYGGTAVCFSPESSVLVTAGAPSRSDMGAYAYDLGRGHELGKKNCKGIYSIPEAIASGKGGNTIALASHDLWLLDRTRWLGGCKRLARAEGTGGVICVAISPDETMVASIGAYGCISVWRLTDGASVAEWDLGEGTFYGHDGALAFSADSRVVGVGCHHYGEVYLFDISGRNKPLRLEGPDAGNWGVALSPDLRSVAFSRSRGIVVYDLPTDS